MMFHICKSHLLALAFSLLAVLISPTAWAAVQEQYHVVVDVSGSMQRVDPQKERVTALKTFINQLPEGSIAGVWAYAGQVNMLVSPSVVNAQWRKQAEQAVSTIGGYGPNANLANALAQATHHWRAAPAKPGRNIILLTDNGVKVADPVAQSQARQQLLNVVLPQLKKSQVRVFAVGFSHEDKALLGQIAQETQGAYQSLVTPKEVSAALTQVKAAIANPSAVTASTVVAAAEPTVVAALETPKIEAPVASAEAPKIEAPKAEVSVVQADVAVVEQAAPVVHVQAVSEVPEVSTAQLPPATELGQAESSEIKAQLAVAENKLQELIDEANMVDLATPAEQATVSPTAALSGQQLSEPMVIALDDGSVLVTSDQAKAESLSAGSNKEVPPAPYEANLNASDMLAEEMAEELSATNDASSFSSSFDISEQGLWPVILSILAVLNIAVIFLLFVGRYFWLRHKRRDGSVFTMNYGGVPHD